MLEYNNYLLLTGICIGIERKRQNKKQEVICENICSVKTLSNMEQGKYIVKNKTYYSLSRQLNFDFDYVQYRFLIIIELYEEFYNFKNFSGNYDINRLTKKVEELLTFNEIVLNYLCELLLLIIKYKNKTNVPINNYLVEFISVTYKYLPVKIRDLCLNFLSIYYNNIGNSTKLNEVIHKKEYIKTNFNANILYYLSYLANNKSYLDVIDMFTKFKQNCLVEKNYCALLVGYEILLIPVLITNPSNLLSYIEKCEDVYSKIDDTNFKLDRSTLHYFNIGLVLTYAKDYKLAHFYLKKSISPLKSNILINDIIYEYVCNRLSEDDHEIKSDIEFSYYDGNSNFKNEYNYFYYKKNNLLCNKELQNYINKMILPNNLDGTEILYQVFLFEMIKLCNATKAYLYLKKYIEIVCR